MRETQAHWPRLIGNSQYEARSVDLNRLLSKPPRVLLTRSVQLLASTRPLLLRLHPSAAALYLNLALEAKHWTCYFLDSGLPELLPRQSLRRTSRRCYDRQYRRRLDVHS